MLWWATGEAPVSGRKQAEQEESMGESLDCGFHRGRAGHVACAGLRLEVWNISSGSGL